MVGSSRGSRTISRSMKIRPARAAAPHRRFPFLPSTLEPHEQIYYRSKPQTENKRFHSLPPYNALSAVLKTRKS